MVESNYFCAARKVLQQIEETQKSAIQAAAAAIADCYANNGMLFAFGTGHSSLIASEIFYRAGGFAGVYPIYRNDLLLFNHAAESSENERKPSIAAELIQNANCGSRDVVLVISNSGRNCAPVEAAIQAKKQGARVIALTSLAHSSSCEPRNPYGKRLFEVADIVLDNCGVIGDASLESEKFGIRFAPTSTVAGAAILWEVIRQVIELFESQGKRPEVFLSANLDGGDEYNKKILEKYQKIVPCL